MAGPFKMKNPLLSKASTSGESISGNYASPARATDPTSGTTETTKSKDPIGDWLRAAGKQLREDFGKGGNLEKDIQKKSDAVEGVVRGVEGNITKGVQNVGKDLSKVKSGIEKGAQTVAGNIEKQVRQVGSNLSEGKKKLETNLQGAGDQIRGDLKNLHNFLQGKRKYNKETKKWEDK